MLGGVGEEMLDSCFLGLRCGRWRRDPRVRKGFQPSSWHGRSFPSPIGLPGHLLPRLPISHSCFAKSQVLRDAKSRQVYDQRLSLRQTASNTPISEEVDVADMDNRVEDGKCQLHSSSALDLRPWPSHDPCKIFLPPGECWYSHPCRCGGTYDVPESELDEAPGSVIVGCG